MLSNMSSDVTQKQIENFFKTTCMQVGSTMFESVRVISALRMAYVVFPTINAAKTIYRVSCQEYSLFVQNLNGYMSLNGRDKIEVSFTPNTMRNERQEVAERVGGQAALFG